MNLKKRLLETGWGRGRVDRDGKETRKGEGEKQSEDVI